MIESPCWRLGIALVVPLALTPALLFSQSPDQTTTPPPHIRTFGPAVFTGFVRARLSDLTMTAPADNPIADAKAALGQRLFFDPVLSSDRSVSCATCHKPERAFADERTLAVGVFGRVGRRNSPSLVNRGFGKSHFWDGRASSLEDQVLQPIRDTNEMDLPIDSAVARLEADGSYALNFRSVFDRPPMAEDLSRSLATFVRTIRSGDSPYDRFIGDVTGTR